MVDGLVKPYLLDTWTGEVSEVATFRHENGKTTVPVQIPDGDVRVYIFKEVYDEGLHVTSTDARARRWSQHGEQRTIASEVPESRALTGWDVSVESWNRGPLSEARSETTSVGDFTEEYTYLTDKTDISFELGELAGRPGCLGYRHA